MAKVAVLASSFCATENIACYTVVSRMHKK